VHRVLALGIALGVWAAAAPAAGLTWQEMSLVEETTVALLADPRVSGLDAADIVVDVRGGALVLHGAVATEHGRHAATEVAQAVAGTIPVTNALGVDPASAPPLQTDRDLARQVKARLKRDPVFRGAVIRGTVRDGVVRLTGAVADLSARAAASRRARAVPGVRAVRNDLGVKEFRLSARGR